MTSQRARDRLVERLRSEGIQDRRVLEAMRRVPRHLFVDQGLASRAYEDSALPIGLGQTISQPWIVARMTEALIEEHVPEKVLEIGTGSGYQTLVLAYLVPEVYTIERIMSLWRQARMRFRQAHVANIRSRHDDGRAGWPQAAPFGGVLVTAAGEAIEPAWIEQLAPGGTLVAPIGPAGQQTLVRLRKDAQGQLQREDLGAVSFVPLLQGVR